MAAAPVARESGPALAQNAQEPQAEPARRAEGVRGDWDTDWDAIPDPLGGEALPLVMEVYRWLSLATSGTTRGLRNRPFNAVLLQMDGGDQKVPPGGWVARQDHERVPRGVLGAGWPAREPTWPAFLERGAVLRVTDAEANSWLPRALRIALSNWHYRPRNPPPPQPELPRKQRRSCRPRLAAMVRRPAGRALTPGDGHGGLGAYQRHGKPPPRQARTP